MIRIHSVQVGKVAPLGRKGIPSGFVKHTLDGRTSVFTHGLNGDEQADLRAHGGPHKAVYAYSLGHYSGWKADFPGHSAILIPGAFGENLTVEGLTENDICVGDVHRIGTAILQVSQPRQPCFKLALHFDDKHLPSAMVRSGRCGWYYRVLLQGELGPGDQIELINRPQPTLSFRSLIDFVNFGKGTHEELRALSSMEEVTAGIRRRAVELLSARGFGNP